MRHLDAHGLRLAYDTAGEAGTPVLLIMGYTMPGRAWMFQIPALSKVHRVAWFDHRGAGETSAPPGPYTTRLLARDAVRLLDHLGWERAHVVGVSMGGMVAQEMALEHRERLLTLTLIATHPGGMRYRVPTREGLARFVAATAGDKRDRVRHLERLLFPQSYLATCDRAHIQEILKRDFGTRVPAAYRLSQLSVVVRHDTRARLRSLAGLPTLIIKPGEDILVRPSGSDALARLIPGARVLKIANAGHGVIRQAADTVNEALLAHFQAVD
jgi:3-oxoadipate enol-lactonase